jgi:hypothetical protein
MNIRTLMLSAACLPLLGLAAHAQPSQSGQPDKAALAAAQAEADSHDLPPGWPREGATLLVENDRGAAYNVNYYKDKPTALHRHRYFFAGLDLNTASVSVKRSGETEWSPPNPVVKDRMWYLPKGLTHAEMTTTNPGRHTVVIDIKDKSVPEAANNTQFPTGKFAPSQTKVVDNHRVIIWDCAWSSREGQMSFNSRDMFIAFAEGGNLSITTPGQPARVKHYDAGQAVFLPGGQARAITASGTTTIHAMLVEVK